MNSLLAPNFVHSVILSKTFLVFYPDFLEFQIDKEREELLTELQNVQNYC